jgi:hypothetical protein
MFLRVFTLCLFAVTLLCATALAEPNLSGMWHASAMGATVDANLQQQGNSVNGVAYVRAPGGKKGTYHFKGNVSGASITAAHHSGHRFSGTIRDYDRISGVITTRGGQSMPVQLTRR